jgi:hypothetical protein
MTNQQAQAAANHILDDRKGADYYQDPNELANYLKNSLGVTEVVATQTANDINDDRNGANFYQDETIFAQFLESRMNVSEKA